MHNVKLKLLPNKSWVDLIELSKSKPAIDRLDGHGLLLTAHQRMTDGSGPRPYNGQSTIR